jgi:hypothetical protein
MHGMSNRRGATLPALALAAVLLAGCGNGSSSNGDNGDGTAAPDTTTSSAAPAPDGDANGDTDGDGAPQPPFPANTEPDLQQASADAFGNITDIRLGRHEGFDRVVFDYEGAGTPGWDVRYVDQAASQGSGNAIDVAGDGTLQVTVTGVGYPPDTGVEEYSGPRRISIGETEIVTEVVFDATFEGTTVSFVGTETETPFRVYLLEGPTRIVLEVADAS